MRQKNTTFFISAGEFSGDLLAADLVTAIRDRVPRLKGFGLTGDAMRSVGIESIADIKEFNVMGVWEVAKQLPDIAMARRRILHAIDIRNPVFAVLVDFPGFHFALAEDLKMRGIPVFQYVAPKLWAWGEGRAKRLRENFDAVLGVLPFEDDFFKSRGVPYTYVGSPHRDRVSKISITPADLGLPSDRPVVALLPGSRVTELRKIMPSLLAIAREIRKSLKSALFLVPVANSLSWEEVEEVLGAPLDGETPDMHGIVTRMGGKWHDGICFLRGMSLEIMAISKAAVVASGTATLECALLGTPMAVVYAVSGMSHVLMKKYVKVKYASLVNLIANRLVVREFLQEFTPQEVAREIVELVDDGVKRSEMLETFESIRSQLTEHAAFNAANVICDHLGPRLPISSNLRP